MRELERVLGVGKTKQQQFPRPQVATVRKVTGTDLYVEVDGLVHGPCRWGRPAAHSHSNPEGGLTGMTNLATPPIGTECLVSFADDGIADPWVIAWDGWAP